MPSIIFTEGPNINKNYQFQKSDLPLTFSHDNQRELIFNKNTKFKLFIQNNRTFIENLNPKIPIQINRQNALKSSIDLGQKIKVEKSKFYIKHSDKIKTQKFINKNKSNNTNKNIISFFEKNFLYFFILFIIILISINIIDKMKYSIALYKIFNF